jgi:malic enzyme
VEAFVAGVQEVWPGCLIQWEDFKQYNALRILDRFRHRVPSFNDDVQGTAAVVLAGVLAGLRGLEAPITEQRVVLAGAGAAGIGIAGLMRAAMLAAGADEAAARRALVLVDSRGLVHEGRADLDASKRAVALPRSEAAALGLDRNPPAQLLEVVEAIRPTVLLGTTGVAGSFSEAVVRAMAGQAQPPLIMPLSNPTSNAEATPEQILRWTDGRAIVATGSPFPPVQAGGRLRQTSQANNVYIFPGLGLGAMVAEVREVSDAMIMAAATTLAGLTEPAQLAAGSLYPPIDQLRRTSRAIAVAVVEEAVRSGLGHLPAGASADDEVDAAMWWPDYVPYSPLEAAG